MSTLKVNSIRNVSNKRLLDNTGNVVQVIHVRTDARSSWSSNNRYIFTPITSLNLTITPKHPNNLIVVQVELFCEVHHDNVMTILRDYGRTRNLGYGQTENRADNYNPRHQGMIPADYTGGDNNSTPRVYFMQGVWRADTFSQVRFTPGVRSAGGSNHTLRLNRTIGSGDNGQNSYEIGYSSMIAYEITAA